MLVIIFLQNCAFWANWGPYRRCSVTCGAGVRLRERICLNGEPGEAGCLGGSADSQACATEVRILLVQ